jgi:hypothetical protein
VAQQAARIVLEPVFEADFLALAQVSLKLSQQALNPVLLLHVRQGDAIHPGGSLVLPHAAPRLPQDVTPADTVIQGVEPALRRPPGRSP